MQGTNATLWFVAALISEFYVAFGCDDIMNLSHE